MEVQESFLTDIESTEVEVSFFQRILSNIIDFILEMVLILLSYEILPPEAHVFLIKNKPISIYLVVVAWISAYRLITLLLLQRTIGMLLCRSKYLNENLLPLTPREKMIAAFVIRTKKIRIYKA